MSQRFSIGNVEDFPVGVLKNVAAQGTLLVVAQVTEGQFCAVLDECSHLLLPIAGGTPDGTVITCPHHLSQFDLCSGANLDWVRRRAGVALPKWSRRLLDRGKKPPPLTTVPVIVEDGAVFVELPG
jgi:nitrite reductase/ring-hydroxylating ferredoxin subunit